MNKLSVLVVMVTLVFGLLLISCDNGNSPNGVDNSFIGDGNNMANSMIVGCLKCGMDVSVACPEDYAPDDKVLDFAASITDNEFVLTDDPKIAAEGADVIFTDVWASMGQEDEIVARQKAFRGFIVDDDLLSLANSDPMVMHCLPAHKGEEISEEVFESHATQIFDEAENRLHVQKAIMYLLMKDA